ncbi:hypothetical protein ACFX2A_019004 [Malus domestica]
MTSASQRSARRIVNAFCGVDQEIWAECRPEKCLDQLLLLLFYVVVKLSHLIVVTLGFFFDDKLKQIL